MFGNAKAKRQSVLLGLDVRDDVIHAAVTRVFKNTVEILDHGSQAVEPGPNLVLAQTEALRALVAAKELKGLRTVVSSPSPDIVGTFGAKLPTTRGIDVRQWALTQLEEHLPGGTQGTYIADAAISRVPGERIIGFARRSDLETRLTMLKAVGLELVAFDAPTTAWQRYYGKHFEEDFDCLLDTDDRNTLYLFKEPIGYTRTFTTYPSPDMLATDVKRYLTEMRRNDPDLTINRLVVHGKGSQEALVEALRRADSGIEFQQVSINTDDEKNVDPPWAFAAALATWNAPIAIGMRVNLLNADKRGFEAFGRSFTQADIIPAVAAAAAAAVVAIGMEIGYNSIISSVNYDDGVLTSQISVANAHANKIALIQGAVERLRSIDRDRYWLDRSGRIVALRLVDLANAIPSGTTIARLAHDPKAGWRITGDSASLGPIAQTQDALAKASPGQSVMMIHEAQSGDNNYTFDLTINAPKPGDGILPSAAPRVAVNGPLDR
jgi:hypothetical protein